MANEGLAVRADAHSLPNCHVSEGEVPVTCGTKILINGNRKELSSARRSESSEPSVFPGLLDSTRGPYLQPLGWSDVESAVGLPVGLAILRPTEGTNRLVQVLLSPDILRLECRG